MFCFVPSLRYNNKRTCWSPVLLAYRAETIYLWVLWKKFGEQLWTEASRHAAWNLTVFSTFFLFGFPFYGKFLPVLCWVTHFRFCYSHILSNCTFTYLRFLFLCIFKLLPIKCFYGKAVKHRCDSVNKILNQYGECIMCDTLYLKSLEFLFLFFLNTNG